MDAPFQHSVLLSSTYRLMLRRYLQNIRHKTQKSEAARSPAESAAVTDIIAPKASVADIQLLFQEIEKEVGHSGFTLDVANTIHPSDYGLLGYALMNCPNLYSALELAARYKSFLNEGFEANMSLQGKHLHYTIDNSLNLKTQEYMVELDFAAALQFGRFLAGPHRHHEIRIEWVHFKHAPKRPIADYESHFQCPVLFAQAHNSFSMERSILKLPIHGANADILSLMREKLTHLETMHRQQNGFSDRVYRYLCQHIGPDFPDASQVANAFHVSLSAFKKRLKQEQRCFQQLSDEVREQAACSMLRDNSLRLKEIAWQLGFASSSAFNRAFKRWTGLCPAAYRRRHASSEALAASRSKATQN